MLLIVIKSEGGGDNLFVLRKVDDHFQSTTSMPCGFVEMTGKYQLENLKPMRLEAMPEWSELKEHEISRTRFWWGGQGDKTFMWRTLCIRSYLSMTEPNYQSFLTDPKDSQSSLEFFGLWDKQNQSLVIAQDDYLIAYGSPAAKERLLEAIRQWAELGMPALASFELSIYPSDVPLTPHEGEWIIRRKESQFLWTLQK